MSPSLSPRSSTGSSRAPLNMLRERMLANGWAPDDIQRVQGALIARRLHENYLRAGFSPDEIEQITSLY
jgi:hypothetical protein